MRSYYVHKSYGAPYHTINIIITAAIVLFIMLITVKCYLYNLLYCGWRAVSAGRLQGNGSQKRNVFHRLPTYLRPT